MSGDEKGSAQNTDESKSKSPSVDIQTVRDRLIDKGLVYFAFFIPLPLTLSLVRIFEHGWHPIYLLHIGIALAIITGAVFRKRLSYRVRAFLLIGFWLVAGTAGMYVFGLVGGGPPLLLFIFAMMMAIAFGTRAGLVACAIDLVIIVAIGAGIRTGVITHSFDTYEYATSPTAWLLMSAAFITFAPIPIIALGVMQSYLVASLRDLRNSQKRNEHLVDNLVETYLYRHDVEGVINYVTSSITGVLGYTPEEFLNHYSEYLTDHPINLEVVKHTEQSMSGIQQPPYETQKYHKDGRIRWLEVAETPVRDNNGKVVAVEGVAHDITERKHSEEALRESESRNRAIVETMPDMMFRLSRDGTYLDFQAPRDEELFVSPEEIIGKTISELLPEDTARKCMKYVERAFKEGTVQAFEYELDFPGKGRRFYDTRMVLCGEDSVLAVVRNVTQHKLVENAFQGKEAQLNNLLANVDAIILEGDPIDIYYVGGQVERILGYPKEAWFEHPQGAVGFWSSLLHPDDMGKMEECKKSIEQGRDHAFEYRLRASDGKMIWFYDSVTVETDNGKPVKTRSVMIDITERKRTEEAVRKSETKYRTFFENSVDAMLIIRDYKFVDCNAATVVMLGYESKLDLLDTHPWELSPEFQPDGKRSDDKAMEIMEIALARGTHRFEWDHKRKNGEVFPVEVSLTVIQENEETVLHTVWLDITDRKRNEEALRKSEATSRALLNAPTDVAILAELDGTIVALNDAAAATLGRSADQLLGVCAYNFFPPNIAESRKAQADLVVNSGKPVSFEDERQGRVFSIRLYPISNEKGAVVRIAIFVQDLTEARRAEEERRKLEAQLNQAQKMEAVGRLAGGVAHDFNNLLQAILGYGDMALDDIDADSPIREPIEEMLKAGNRAKTLVAQLLAFSRQQVLEMKDLDLNDLVANLTKMIQRVIGAHITLDLLPGHNLGFVRADPGQIEQILINLCINARDAMPTGGTITIKTENVRISNEYCQDHSWAKPGRYTLLSVTDTGCGMDDETLAKIFDPFFTTKGVGEGTGLGLAPVYGLIKQHEGLLHVYTEIDKGTTFKIYLPLVERAAEVVGNKIEGPPPVGTETILLAEDDEMVRDLSQRILEQNGYTVLTADDGEEALRAIEDHADEIDLALLDVVMPKLGGKAVYDHIQEKHPQIRVLFTSGYSMNAIHTDFVLDEGLALIQKPYQRNDLLRRIRDVLDS